MLKEILEMAKAIKGDWLEADEMLGNSFSQEKIDKLWELIDTYKNYEFRKNKMGNLYVLFEKNNNEYINIGFVNLRDARVIGNKLGYKNLMEEIGVGVLKEKRKQGLAKWMYKTLVKHNISIMGDKEQYDNNRKLWISLSKDMDVDIIDIGSLKIIDKKVILKPDIGYNVDDRIWGSKYDNTYDNIRVVLY